MNTFVLASPVNNFELQWVKYKLVIIFIFMWNFARVQLIIPFENDGQTMDNVVIEWDVMFTFF